MERSSDWEELERLDEIINGGDIDRDGLNALEERRRRQNMEDSDLEND